VSDPPYPREVVVGQFLEEPELAEGFDIILAVGHR
jgi:hypothetical protein